MELNSSQIGPPLLDGSLNFLSMIFGLQAILRSSRSPFRLAACVSQWSVVCTVVLLRARKQRVHMKRCVAGGVHSLYPHLISLACNSRQSGRCCTASESEHQRANLK